VVIAGPRALPPREVEPGKTAPDNDGSVTPIVWADDPDGARERARLQGQPLLVFVKADWATASVEMERKVLLDPAVVRAARPFVAIKIDATNDDPATIQKLGTFGVDGVPAIVMELPTTGRREIIASFVEAEDLARALNAFLSK
jgi:thiol:disulfide interchange protein